MTPGDRKLLIELNRGEISHEIFLRDFSADLKKDTAFVKNEMRIAIESNDAEEIELMLQLILLSGDIPGYTDLLNELLINFHHNSHQEIAKILQDAAPSPTTVPFIRKILETNFTGLKAFSYTDSSSIAKWFSWLLYSIGTKEAVDLMEEYSYSDDAEISHEMLYRLEKFRNKNG